MKIAIGLNIFGNYDRQSRCIETLKKLKSKHSEIDLYNVTFENDTNSDNDFIHVPLLKTTAKDIIPNSKSKKPITKEFFNALSTQKCDYFVFLNSDILLSNKLINFIKKEEYETYCFSRHDVFPLNNINDPIVPFRIEIAGFDVWVVKKDWWQKNSFRFENYIYAEHLWDVAYTLEMFNHSNCYFGNKEFFIAHEKHDLKWNEESVEARHNATLWEKTPYHQKWHEFIFSNLVKREPYGQFFKPLYNEKELEKKYLKINEIG